MGPRKQQDKLSRRQISCELQYAIEEQPRDSDIFEASDCGCFAAAATRAAGIRESEKFEELTSLA